MDQQYYYTNSSFYNYNPSSYLPQVSVNSPPDSYNYTFNATRGDVFSSPYQYAYNSYSNQNTPPYAYNENDSAFCSSSDYSNYSLNGTFYNSSVYSVSSPNAYGDQTSKKRSRQESLPETNEAENSAEQSRKRAKVTKLGESDLNIQKLSNNRGDTHYMCSICSIPFESKAKLLMHEHKYHNGGRSKQCPICRKIKFSCFFLLFCFSNILSKFKSKSSEIKRTH